MRVENESGAGGRGPFEDLFRLQSEFQKRLAEETLKYLQQLQGMVGPVAPGTVVSPEAATEVRGAGPAGGRTELRLEVENRQRVFSMVTPMLAPLVGPSGVTWFPASEPRPMSMLIAPGDTKELVLGLPLPADLPSGTYRGVLLLYGFRNGGVPVSVTITRPRGERPGGAGARKSTSKSKATKKKKGVRTRKTVGGRGGGAR